MPVLPKALQISGFYTDPRQGILIDIAGKFNGCSPTDPARVVYYRSFKKHIRELKKEGVPLPYYGPYEFF